LKKYLFKSLLVLQIGIIIMLFFPRESQCRKIDYFAKPQAGLWFGITTPVYTTYNDLSRAIGGGLFFRYTTPMTNLKIGIDSAYLDFGPKGIDGVNTLTLVPIYSTLLYRLPMFTQNFLPLIYQVKAGVGGTWIKIRPDRISQWDPMGILGFEASFPAGRIFNFGLRFDYLLIYEQHIQNAERNGHILNIGLTLYFNI
jgi:hypothetical protein